MFKGALVSGEQFEAIYPSLFRRSTRPRQVYKNADGAIYRVVEADLFPPGRALVFLQKSRGLYYVRTAKLVLNGEVFEFGQFDGNPGRLSLQKKRPEWIQLAPNQSYGEAELVADLMLSLERKTPPAYPRRPDIKPYGPIVEKVRWWLPLAGYVLGCGVVLIGGLAVLRRQRKMSALR